MKQIKPTPLCKACKYLKRVNDNGDTRKIGKPVCTCGKNPQMCREEKFGADRDAA